MRELVNHRGARRIGIAIAAGLAAFEAALVYGAGAIGIPGLFLIPIAAEKSGEAQVTSVAEGPAGGESVVAKPAAPPSREAGPKDAAGEPRLDGLADIPLQDWILPRSQPRAEAETKAKAFGAGAKPRKDDLPWDLVEPVPFDAPDPDAAHADATAAMPQRSSRELAADLPALAALPPDGTVEGWVKAKATEVKGEDRPRPLYHFEFWLDAPEEVRRRLVAVSYEFNTPAIRPQSQISSERQTGFRVNAGGLTCAERVTVTLKFNDGRTQQVAVDGCRLLSSA